MREMLSGISSARGGIGGVGGGSSIQWKRATDDEDGGRACSFGFCETGDAETALTIVRLLNGFRFELSRLRENKSVTIESEETERAFERAGLAVRLTAATRERLDAYERSLGDDDEASGQERRRAVDRAALAIIRTVLGPLFPSSGARADEATSSRTDDETERDIETFLKRQRRIVADVREQLERDRLTQLDAMIEEDVQEKRRRRHEVLRAAAGKDDEDPVLPPIAARQQHEAHSTFVPSSSSSDATAIMRRATKRRRPNADEPVWSTTGTSSTASARSGDGPHRLDDMGRVIRKVVPLDYTEEEKRAVQSVKEQVANVAARLKEEERRTRRREELTGASADALFARPFAATPNDDLRPWLEERLVTYLGESDEDLVAFVLDAVRAETPDPRAVLRELEPILEEDARALVVEMWRKIHLDAM